jgi:hypothetical protein
MYKEFIFQIWENIYISACMCNVTQNLKINLCFWRLLIIWFHRVAATLQSYNNLTDQEISHFHASKNFSLCLEDSATCLSPEFAERVNTRRFYVLKTYLVNAPQFMAITTRWNLRVSEKNSFPHTCYLYQVNLPINFVTVRILVAGIFELLTPTLCKYWLIFLQRKISQVFKSNSYYFSLCMSYVTRIIIT